MSFTEHEYQHKLEEAAQYGLQLLDDKMELQNKLEEQRVEMTAVIEGLEQEKYSLQREVQLKVRMLESLHSEYYAVKTQQKRLLEQQQITIERNHALELDNLKNQMEKMKADLDETQLIEKQLRHQLELQSQIISNKTEELHRMSEHAQETMSSEILELQVKNMELESSMTHLEQEHQQLQYKEEQLQLNNSHLQRQLETLTSTKEERERELSSLYTTLEKSREAYQELQVQLDQVLQEAQDPNSKGNSLFSEVEDKRAEMEKKLISMRVQFQSLQKQHTFSKQQMLRMKVQISNLMQLQGTRADPAQLERLQFMLSEKNSEIEALMRKVQELEKTHVAAEHQSSTGVTMEREFVDETYCTDLLKMQLANSKKAAQKLKDELSMTRMKSLSESHRVLELERKLFAAENALKQGQSENIKLHVKIEELQMKYEPHEVSKARTQRCKREKFPVSENTEKSSSQNSEEPPSAENQAQKYTDTDPGTHPEIPVLTTIQLSDHSKCSTSPTRSDTKRVRICEVVPISIPDSAGTSAEEHERKRLKDVPGDESEKSWRAERSKKHQTPVYISTDKTMERECAQQ